MGSARKIYQGGLLIVVSAIGFLGLIASITSPEMRHLKWMFATVSPFALLLGAWLLYAGIRELRQK
jgi:hypothetical protein